MVSLQGKYLKGRNTKPGVNYLDLTQPFVACHNGDELVKRPSLHLCFQNATFSGDGHEDED